MAVSARAAAAGHGRCARDPPKRCRRLLRIRCATSDAMVIMTMASTNAAGQRGSSKNARSSAIPSPDALVVGPERGTAACAYGDWVGRVYQSVTLLS